MSSLILKIVAIITMTIDHSGSILFNNNQVFRLIGRIAFPLYGFMLVEGFNHTKNDKKRFVRYLLSILILGLISEVIYDVLFHNSFIYIGNQNILFTLSISLICMYVYENFSSTLIDKISSIIIAMIIALTGSLLLVDYSFFGIMLIFGYYLASRSNKPKLMYVLVTVIYFITLLLIYKFKYSSLGILLSVIPMLLYNGKKGYKSKLLQYFFYIYYPLHLLILLIIKIIINN